MCWTCRHAALFALTFLLCLAWVRARELTQSRHEWQIGHFPDPNRDVDRCGRRGQKSWICDPDELLSFEAANVVESIIQDVAYGAYPFTRKACGPEGVMRGYQIGVALMNKISVKPKASHSPVKGHGSWETPVVPPAPGDADLRVMAQKFAMATFNSWGVGDPECNNGVLLLVSRQDRVVYIATGRGASTSLPESSIALVIGRMKPELRGGNYDLAVQGAVRDIGELLAGDPHGRMREGVLGPEPLPVVNETPDRVEYLTVTFFLSSFAIIIGWQWRRERDYQRCVVLLAQLDRDASDARAGAYRSRVCPICLEPYPEVPPGTRLLTCGHRFCTRCVDAWVGKDSPFRFIRRTPLCPVCQLPIAAPPGIEGGLDAPHTHHSNNNHSDGHHHGGGSISNDLGAKGVAAASCSGGTSHDGHDHRGAKAGGVLRDGGGVSAKSPLLAHVDGHEEEDDNDIEDGGGGSRQHGGGGGGAGGSSRDRSLSSDAAARLPLLAAASSSTNRRPDPHAPAGAASSASLGGAHAPGSTSPQAPSSLLLVPASGLLGWDAFHPEYVFRLGRLHARYPAYVTREMLSDASSMAFEGQLAADARVVLRNPCQEGRGSVRSGTWRRTEYPIPGAG